MAWNVVIAGGGFGGYYATRTLEKVLPAHSARITLVNDVNFLLYTPLLPGAAGGTLEPRHVVVPLREELDRAELLLGTVKSIDSERRSLCVSTPGDRVEQLSYDHLVIALGSVSRTLPIPGLEDHAIGLKTLSEAIALRNRVIANLERAEGLEDPAERAAYLSFVVVGAGYAGVEGLAELQDFMVDVIDRYPRCRAQGMRWVLVEARDRVMPEVGQSLSDFAVRELRGRGIEVLVNTTVREMDERSITLSSGEEISTRTVVWTAGVKPHPSVARLGLPLDSAGRIDTSSDLRVAGRQDIWAIGDAAGVPDPARKGESCPPTAQHAIRQGRLVARNIAAELGAGGRVKPFQYKTLGVFVDLGRYEAVASTMGIRWRGFPAWFLARTYHMALMPGGKRKLRLLIDWTVDLLFSRDASELGQLGHPAALDAPLAEQSAGGTSAEDASQE